MSGALFIINIPTEIEEKQLREKSKKIRFDIPNFTTKSINTNNNVTVSTAEATTTTTTTAKSSFLRYGTFHQTKNNDSSSKTTESGEKFNIEMDLEKSEKPMQNLEEIFENSTSSDQHQNKKLSLNKQGEDEPETFNISMDSSMEVILKDILKKLKIENSTWTKSDNQKFYQIIFSIEFDERYETILKKFNEWGIGEREDSTVCILHCATFNTSAKNDDKENKDKTTWNRFMNTFTARLHVAQIVRDIKQEASITFDFIVLLLSAAILASFGLVGDSTIFLASSMLVSPLMGPIIASIFGTAIKDYSLQSLGIINELIGIVLATIVGCIFGIIMCAIDEKYETGDGFTEEILSRCELNSLLIGILIAIPSGAAAAIAVLGGNTGSLVGVAISASILPPAVNSGIVWAFASVSMIYQSDENRFNFNVTKQLYSDDQAFELLIRGAISMCITFSNVICIYIMGILVLKIKEIAPVISRNNNQFWKHDIKIARNLSKNSNTENDKFLTDITTIPKDNKNTLLYGPKIKDVFNISNASYQNTWSPMGNRYQADLFENRSNLRELEKLYMTVIRPNRDFGKYYRTNTVFPLGDTISNRSSVYRINSNELLLPTYRRASMSFETFQNSKQFRSRVGNNMKWQPLEKIWEGKNLDNLENSTSISSMSNNKKKLSTRKFIITPALDNQTSAIEEKS